MIKQTLMKAVGFFVNRFMQATGTAAADGLTSSPAMAALCRRAAAEGCVLLENDDVLPLGGKTVALFGRAAYNTFYTGYGSGGDVRAPYYVSIADGLAHSSVALDAELDKTYRDWTAHPPYDGFWGFWPLNYPEMPVPDAAVRAAAARTDAAVIVIGRSSGEDRENKRKAGSYYLTRCEKKLIKSVSAHFRKVCVLVNSGSTIDTSWVRQLKIGALMYVWQGGQETGNAVADVVSGKVSPCGKLPDTVAPLDAYPCAAHFGRRKVSRYTEDIYVGYRYFETFAKDAVVYPFGYGLSYTRFAVSGRLESADEVIRVRAAVRNIGGRAGKEVVQLYAAPPQGALGKPARVLVAFAKTDILPAGQSTELTFTVPRAAFASYDDTGAVAKNAWVLEAGDYELYAGTDVRAAARAGSFTVAKDTVVLRTEQACPPVSPFRRLVRKRGEAAYENVPLAARDLKRRIVERLPRPLPPPLRSVSPTDVAAGNATVEEFVACLTAEELEALVRGSDRGMYDEAGVPGNNGIIGGTNEALRGRGLPVLSTNDGPSGIRLRCHATLIPIGTQLAATFDMPLLSALAAETGKEMRERRSQVLLAPGLNIHRHPLCGRNFEYFSEDPLLAGSAAAAFVSGLQAEGVSAVPKHFACNNQETGRHVNDSRVSERALREIYLKPFEICVKESAPDYIMMSYNKLNGVWNCYNYDLATTVLRGEWGYDGCVMTDWWMSKASSPEFADVSLQAYRVRAQVDLFMPGSANFGKYKNRSDGSLLRSLAAGGVTLGEIQRCAVNVVKSCLKHMNK